MVRLGVIGAGAIAAFHLQVLHAMPDIEVVGIASRTRAKAESLAAEYAIPHVADDLSGLINQSQPNGLLILVSTDQVYDVSRVAIQYGLPLFIEKPPGLSSSETGRLAELARQRGVQTMVGYNRRYYSIFHKALQVIGQHGPLMGIMVEGHERIGSIRRSNIHPERILSSWLYVNTTHTIDLMRFFGGEVNDVDAVVHRYRESMGDQFAAVIDFSSGTMGTYVSHWLSPGGWRVVLYGDGVMVEFKPLETGRWTDRNYQIHEIEPERQDIDYKPGFYQQMVAFCDMVRGEALQWPGQDLQGAYGTMCLAQKLAESAVDRSMLEV